MPRMYIIIEETDDVIYDWYSSLDEARMELERFRNRAELGKDIFLFQISKLPG